MANKLNPHNVRTGTYLSRISYMRVVAYRPGAFTVQNEEGVQWDISDNIVAAECYSASIVDREVVVNRTEIIDLFNKTDNDIFTVNFNKQPDVGDAYDAVANKGKLKTNKDIKAALKTAMAGEPRTLVGYAVDRNTVWGRTMVVDLEQPITDHLRQVDHRTINWLIHRGTKYVVGTKPKQEATPTPAA